MSSAGEEIQIAASSTPSVEVQLRTFEAGLASYLDRHGLPSSGILTEVEERQVALGNLERVVQRVELERRSQSLYLSKYVAAAATGLFDAALNYLWDETIVELRNRVVQYDLTYFYDNAGLSTEKRKKVSTADHLTELTDSELILGAKEIGLVSQIGYKHLDYIRYMRNWVSAAHPNQNEITGLQLISWLETCLKEVIGLPLSTATVEIKRLLVNVRTQAIQSSDARQISTFFSNLTQEQVNNLASGLFGIYTRTDATATAKDNVRLLTPFLWGRVDEETRRSFGIKYGRFVISNDVQEKEAAREFLQNAGALEYIPEDLKAAEIENAVDQLLDGHRSSGNFYSEPVLARQLASIVGNHGLVPDQVARHYVISLVEVFLTNGNGVAWNAEPIYESLLSKLDTRQALIAILSFQEDTIASRLQFTLSQQKFRRLLELMKPKATSPAAVEIISLLDQTRIPLDRLRDDARVKQRLAALSLIS